jgi:prevent-host-death family protein
VRRISHRQFRNDSSEILRAVDNGESCEITNYGRAVGLVVPAPSNPLEQLRAAGRTRPTEVIAGAELDAMRDER